MLTANPTHNALSRLPVKPTSSATSQEFVSVWLSDLHYDWTELKQHGKKRRVKKEEVLFLEGSASDTVYIVEDGRIRLVTCSAEGTERHLAVIGSNGLVGDCGLFSIGRRVISAIASSEATVFEVPREMMIAAIQRDSAIMRQYLELVDIRFRIMLQHFTMLGTSSARQRVCYHLLGLMQSYSVPHRDGHILRILFTQQEMANVCSISRVSVSNIFTTLEVEHIIAHEGRFTVICNPQRLKELATKAE